MIRLSDATVLAYTKLRVHKIRTGVTIIISSLLFSLLVASLIVTQGAFSSIQDFSKEGFGDRYLVRIPNNLYNSYDLSFGLPQEKTIIDRAKVIYKETIAAKKAAATKLGIFYDETSEQQPTYSDSGKVEDSFLNVSSPAAIQAMTEYKAAQPKYDMTYLKSIAAPYHPIAFYDKSQYITNDATILLMKDGKENFSLIKPSQTSAYSHETDVESLFSYGYAFDKIDNGLTDPFLLAKNSTKISNPDSIPVLIPYSSAEKLLNLVPLTNANSTAKLDRIKEIQAKAPSISYSACYRNSISKQQIDSAISTADDIEKNKNNPNYQKPDLIYGLPAANTCGAATVIRDTRTSLQKSYTDKQNQFDKQFGAIVDPDQQKINFHVIGLIPDAPTGDPTSSATGIIQTLVGSSVGYGTEVPSNLFNQLPNAKSLDSILAPKANNLDNVSIYTVEFASADNARRFIADKNCTSQNNIDCIKAGTPFQIYAFGSNSIALSDIKTTFADIFKIAALVIVVMAAIIMSGTLGRMIADSRRETAVFRAIGFKRIDIVNIYVTYVMMLSVFIAILSFVIGIGIAYMIDQMYWQDFTVQSLLSFGASDINRQFHLFKLDSPELLWVAGAILASGLISTIIPLLRNIRRNPINDMRDE